MDVVVTTKFHEKSNMQSTTYNSKLNPKTFTASFHSKVDYETVSMKTF